MREIIIKAVHIFRNNPTMDDPEIYQRIVAENVEPDQASNLIELLPLAYGRALLDDTGANFSDSYLRMDKYGQLSPVKPLTSMPLWNAIVEYAQSEIRNGITVKDLLAIAFRSGEFKAITQMKQNGSNISDCIFSPPIFVDHEASPEAIRKMLRSQTKKLKVEKKKWWQFWQ